MITPKEYKMEFIRPTLNGPRRTGRTTRIINDAIETIYQQKWVWLIDHHDSARAQESAAQEFIQRLKHFHRLHYPLITFDVIQSDGHLWGHLGTVFFMADQVAGEEHISPLPGLRSQFDNTLLDAGLYDQVSLKNRRVIPRMNHSS